MDGERGTASSRAFGLRVVSYALLLVGVIIVSGTVWLSIGRNLDFAWTSIRLAPAFALAHGHQLYSTPDQPPWVMVGYGPLYPVAYLPTVFARHPVSAVTAATLLAHFYILAPVALICSLLSRGPTGGTSGKRLHWIFTALLFALLTPLAPSLTYITAGVHADAPAFALFLLGCYAVLHAYDAAPAVALRWVAAAGALAGLSLCCKLNLAAGAVALSLWLAVFCHWRRAVVFIAFAALATVAVYGWAIARDGFDAVWLNLRQPARMPWFTFHELGTISLAGNSHEIADKVHTFLALARSYLQDYGPVALAVLLITRWDRLTGETTLATRVVWFFMFLALVMMPLSIASIGKYGGDVNSRALVTLPLALAAIFALATAVERSSRGALLANYAATAGAIFLGALPLWDGWKRSRSETPTTMGEAYSVIVTDPSRWYFPYDPLAHLLAEGKFRPNIDVIYSYAVSGTPVDETAFRSALPENLRYIAVPPSLAGWGVTELQRLVPEYMTPARGMQFPRHQVYGR